MGQDNHYDIIIIGSGAGGGTLAHALAGTGKRILLLERGDYEICELCYWEDDGQDEAHLDEVWGGPNHHYSLRDAQENFQRYWSIFDPNDDPRVWRDSAPVLHAKQALTQLFDLLCTDISADIMLRVSDAVHTMEQVLRSERERSSANIGDGWLKGSSTGLFPTTI